MKRMNQCRKLAGVTMVARAWIGRKPLRTKAVIGAAAAAAVLLLLWIFVNDHGFIFFAAELSHVAGISFLIYKLIKDRICAGENLHYCICLLASNRLQ